MQGQCKRGEVRGGAGGFTLIELMIVVAIVALLATVAYPSYVKHVARANRAAAESFMFEVSSRQERYLVDARQYANSIDGSGTYPLNMNIPTSVSNSYTVTVINVTATPPGYTVQAVPVGVQATNDAMCGTLTLDSTGNKTASGPGGVSACWKG